MAGYTRNDTSNNIATGNVINAADLDGEFDALVAAFHASTGHTHDGTAANGAPITKIGPAQDLVISTGAITPKTDNTVDLGSSSFEFKDLYIDGTANIDALVADTADINAGTIDGVTLGTNSAVTEAQIDNININGNTISSTDTNGNISLVPNGTGDVILTADTIQVGDSNTDVTVTTNGTGDLIFNTNAGTNSGVIRIYDGANGNIALTPNGTGEVDISKVDIDSGAIDGTAIGANSASTGAFTTLSASSTVTLSGGTANGVLYLNGSKVATSGSALTFDGSTFNVVDSSSPRFSVNGSSTASGYLIFKNTTSNVNRGYVGYEFADDAMPFAVGGSEQMRLTSTGLGIGTSLPAAKLDLNASGSNAQMAVQNWPMMRVVGTTLDIGGYTASQWTAMRLYTNNAIAATLDSSGNLGIGTSSAIDNAKLSVYGTYAAFANGTYKGYVGQASALSTGGATVDLAIRATEKLWLVAGASGAASAVLDSSGNLGLGVTPSGWITYPALQISNASLWGAANNAYLGANYYFGSGSTRRYISNGYASEYSQVSGVHSWFTAPSGTAGNTITFTQAMTLDASGNLGVGTTSPAQRLHVSVATVGAGAFLQVSNTGDSQTAYFGTNTSGGSIQVVGANPLQFATNSTERARITSGGYFKASNDGTYNNAAGTYHELRQTANAQGVIVSVTNASFTSESIFSTATKTAGTDWMHFYGTSDGNTVANIKIFGNGNVQNANNSYAGISDQKLKQDIVDAGSQWDDIKNLRVRKYRFKATPDAPLQIGLVAQEAETVSPGLVEETVDRNAEGNDLGITTKAVKYSVLYMKSVKALQEAMARIETLEAKVSALEGN